jgi:peptidoglycan/LPS O-acetylase OafA/YrhL
MRSSSTWPASGDTSRRVLLCSPRAIEWVCEPICDRSSVALDSRKSLISVDTDSGGVVDRTVRPRAEPVLRPEMPELDAIRGLAILGVLIYHGLYWGVDLSQFSKFERVILTGMWVGRLGVNLFFVLSGFLITGLLVDGRSKSNYYSRFYIRRGLRILPAYSLTILILLVTRLAPLRFIVLSVLYLSNLTPLFGVAIAYPVLWSLAVEEHFYFLWPFAVRAWANRRLLGLLGFVIIFSPVSRLISFYLTSSNGFVSYVCNDYTWNALDGLACGAALAICLRQFNPSREIFQRALLSLLVIAVIIWGIGFPLGILTRQEPLGAALQVTPWHFLFVAFIGLFLLVGSSPHKRFVQVKSLRLLGDVSYGLYLYHLLIFALFDYLVKRAGISVTVSPIFMLLTRFLIVAAIAIPASLLSRRLFEDRFLNLKKMLAP